MVLFAVLTGCAWTQTSGRQVNTEFDGTWVLRINGQNIFKLTLATERGLVTGSLTRPKKLAFDEDGDVIEIGLD